MPDATTDQALLDAFRRVLSQYGYRAATLERIAAAAGLSRVTLHRHGVTKAGLFEQLVAQAIEDYRRRLWPAITGDGSAAERLEQALLAVTEAAEANLSLLVALQSRTDGIFHEDGADEALTRTTFTEPLERLLRDGAAERSLRDVDPVETSTVLFNSVGWTYIHLRSGHGWPATRASRAVIDLALRGLRPEPGASTPPGDPGGRARSG